MSRKNPCPGLRWDNKTQQGIIDKRIAGTRIYRRFRASNRQEAEAIYHQAVAEATQPKPPPPQGRTFTQAATQYLKTQNLKALGDNARILKALIPWIGHLPLSSVHQGTLQPYIDHAKEAGLKSGTVTRHLAIVGRVLELAARVWRDEQDRPWLPQAPPILQKPNWEDKAKPYPLNREEQRRLMDNLPRHLQRMAIFALNTGAREAEITGLRWEWETRVPELGTSVFIVPGQRDGDEGGTKSGKDHHIILNRPARNLIDQCRGEDPDYVFTWRGNPVARINNSAWRKAWEKAGLPTGKDVLHGPHNLRHTVARRLEMAGVPKETREAILHHRPASVTLSVYSPVGLRAMLEALESLETAEGMTLLKVVPKADSRTDSRRKRKGR